jgi:hypothetical protein
MKKNILQIILTTLFVSNTFAQETTVNEVLSLTVESINGTARYRGLSGAFGAIGGDLSSINQNAAGSIFFNNNFATGTLTNYNRKNSASYFGNRSRDNDVTLDINQAGAVFVFNNMDEKSDWKKFAIALNYENANNFRNSTIIAGVNPNNSIGNYFVNNAQGIQLGILRNIDFTELNFQEQQAFLGYETFIFDPVNNNNNNTAYFSNVPNGGNYFQENKSVTDGLNGKFTINTSAAYQDKLFFGLNLNYNTVDLRKTSLLYENNNNSLNDVGSTITEIFFENDLRTYGFGLSLDLGIIAMPIKNLRLGLSYSSPTWYRLRDELTQGVITRSVNNELNIPRPTSLQPTIVYLPYRIQTPSRYTGSAAYIFGKKGLLSVDVSSKNYADTRIKPKNDLSYFEINSFMDTQLQNAIDLRLGGEYRIKQTSLRGGYRFEQSPFKNNDLFGDLTGFSLGAGYSFNEHRIDLAFSHDYRRISSGLISSGMNDLARVSQNNNTVTISYSINF